jgi:hypothetical protein
MTESDIMARFRHRLAVVFERDPKKIMAFLQKHGFERPADVSEEKALAMLAELDANNGKIPESSPNGGV